MNTDAIFDGLNPEQRRAVEALRGPVCILAGAGSGKTTTITRRIAWQVATGTFAPGAILAVTFTDKAAGEMRARLQALGVRGVPARTFHAAALGQLRALADDPPEQVLPTKAFLLRQIGNSLPRPYRFRPAADLATEVEWAKNRRLTPQSYLDGLGEHAPPIPADLMERVFRQYERRKQGLGRVDFEDLLELAIRMFEEAPRALETFQQRYLAFTVDEFQDVNLLQWTLLERWLGAREDVCVVGDDYQSIYAFTGATPRYLLELPTRFPAATVVRLESNYRSTPQVLELANQLVPRLGGAEKVLRPTKPAGPEPVLRACHGPEETEFVVSEVRRLHEQGVPHEEMAVLYRVNARSEGYEGAFAEAGIAFQVRAGPFLARQAARQLLRRLEGVDSPFVAATVHAEAERDGLVRSVPQGVGEHELTRQADLARLVKLAEEFDDGTATVTDFVADLRARFGEESEGRGVNLLTYHRAKGLEFEAVFLPRLEEKELPSRQAKSEAAVDEERRLLYVGMTRAKRHLFLTWSSTARPSRFLAELGGGARARPVRAPADDESAPAFGALRRWRSERARAEGVPAYIVFPDRTLTEIALGRPGTLAELAAIPGIGPAKLERYGTELLAVLAAGEAGTASEPPPAATLAEPLEAQSLPADVEALASTLKVWRRERAKLDEVPAYVVLHDRTLTEIARRLPRSLEELAGVPGIGPAKLERYGEEVLAALATE